MKYTINKQSIMSDTTSSEYNFPGLFMDNSMYRKYIDTIRASGDINVKFSNHFNDETVDRTLLEYVSRSLYDPSICCEYHSKT
jgi:hypothetical protein